MEFERILKGSSVKFKETTFYTNDIIYSENVIPNKVYILKDGMAKILCPLQDEGYICTGFFETDDVIGGVEVLSSALITYKTECLKKVSVYEFSRKDFEEWCATDFSIVKYIIKAQMKRTSFLDEYLIVSSSFRLKERILIIIINASENRNHCGSLTKQVLIECLGTDIRCINRALKEILDTGYIRLQNGFFYIDDRQKLINLAKEMHVIDYLKDYQ